MDPPRLTHRAPACGPGAGPRRAYADEVAAVYSAYRDGLEAAGLADEELFALARARRPAAEPGGLGRHPAVRLRVRRLRPAPAGCARDASRLHADVTVSLPLRAGTPRVQGGRDPPPGAARGWARRSTSSPRSTTTTRPSRGPRFTTSSGSCSRTTPAAQVDPGGAISFHSAGGERAEVELAAARILAAPARGRPAHGRRGGGVPGPGALLVAARAGLRRLRDPVLDRPQAALRPHRARPRPARPDPQLPRRPARPTTCSPTSALRGS